MKKVLQGVYHKNEYTELVEKEVLAYFEEIFEPLFDLLHHNQAARENALSALRTALNNGKVWYADGKVVGEYSAAVSRELRSLGATLIDGVFHLPLTSLPLDIRTAIAASKARGEAMHHDVLNTLNAMEANIALAATGLTFKAAVDRIVTDLQKQFMESVVKEIDSGSLAVPAQMTPEIEQAMREQLTLNTDIEVKNFTAEQIEDLRIKVQQNLFAGGRPDRLEGILQTQFGVNQRKARFIAENETSLAVSKFRELRYKSLGSEQYVWSTSHDNLVRHDHKMLDGRTFEWSNPPVVDVPTGRRRNPGEDYNCFPGDSRVNYVGGIRKGFRRWYEGELTTIITDSGKTLRATPNHPVLTLTGWKAIGLLNETDKVIEMREKLVGAFESKGEQAVPTISEVFESLRESGLGHTFPGEREDFHGDGADGEVDVVYPTGSLLVHREPRAFESLGKFAFASAASLATALRCLCEHLPSFFFWDSFCCGVGCSGKSLALLESHSGHSQPVGFRAISYGDSRLQEPSADDDPLVSSSLGYGEFTLPSDIGIDDRLRVKLQAICLASGIRKVSTGFFRGHVFNLETDEGLYAMTNVVVSNCRCVALPVINIA